MTKENQMPFASGDTKQLEKLKDVALKSTRIEDIDEALALLNEKMQNITKELAVGKINQAQFQAIYSRYREQREIIQRIKERTPESDAWQRVASKQGITSILRRQHEAEVEGVVILLNEGVRFIKKFGQVELDEQFGKHMLANVSSHNATHTATTQIDDGRWLDLISGPYATSIFFYSTEPSMVLKHHSKAVHEKFEQDNKTQFAGGTVSAKQLQYPHADIFTE